MSLLSPEIHAELTQLLQALQSADNGIRSQAEEHLQTNWTASRPEILLMGLAEQVQGAQAAAVRPSLPLSVTRHSQVLLNPDTVLCLRHLPPYRVQGEKNRLRVDVRHVHFPISRTRSCHPTKAARNAWY